ncbi:kinase-like domain-containing protein [Mycena amicta]|nr:kinase-like domain-containing protein [Mycena amicta]
MAPTRTESPWKSGRRVPVPPRGYNHKRVLDGLSIGASFRDKYQGVHDSKDPYYPPLPLPVPKDIQPDDPRGPALTLSDLECVKLLGKGGNGSVLLVRTRGPAAASGPKLFALKAVGKKVLRQRENSWIENDNSRERTALVNMGWHPFVSGLLQTFYDDRNIYMMLEYSPCGSLVDLLMLHSPMTPSQMVFYFANIMCGLEHLEKSGIVHRDLKPGNILVGADGYLLICDFGPSMPVPEPGQPADETFWSGEGTPFYQAPEAYGLEGQPDDVRHGTAIDWWSSGIVLFEMATGEIPFHNSNASRTAEEKLAAPNQNTGAETFKLIHAGPFKWPSRVRVGRKLKNLVAGLLAVNANTRLGARGGFDEVRQHPWLATVDWNKMRRKWYLPPSLGIPSSDLASNEKPINRNQYPGLHFANS